VLVSLKDHRCNAAQSVSHQTRGECDINEEITSTQNVRFVLHDSMGFEPGQTKNFETAKRFLKSRTGDRIALKDRVHIIWCLASALIFPLTDGAY
jgi:hypothetical protein